MTDKQELLPCPFCGTHNTCCGHNSSLPGGLGHEVFCGAINCGATVSDETAKGAIVKWNTRTPDLQELLPFKSTIDPKEVEAFLSIKWECQARKNATADPQDCGYPACGCAPLEWEEFLERNIRQLCKDWLRFMKTSVPDRTPDLRELVKEWREQANTFVEEPEDMKSMNAYMNCADQLEARIGEK